MEERISAAESRGASPGLIFSSVLNALQQKSSKISRSIKPSTESRFCGSDECSVFNADSYVENNGNIDEAETWKYGLTSTRNKINETWEQYSPNLKFKVQKYSPASVSKLKTLSTVSEEKNSNYDAGEMEDAEGSDEFQQKNNDCIHMINPFPNDNTETNVRNVSSRVENIPPEMIQSFNTSSFPEAADLDDMKRVDHCAPYIILQEADSNSNEIKETPMNVEPIHRRKSPLTVQEWVDHLPTKNNMHIKDCENSLPSNDYGIHCGADSIPHEKKSLLVQRLSRDASLQSSSSLDSLLDSRRPDPVEVLLNLGFGVVPGVDMNNCRIPKRFLVPSKCKGGDWNEFLKRELLQAQNFECASLGFRGLSGPSYRRPSAIVANIMEKLREKTSSRHHLKSKFSSVARRILNEKSVLNKLILPSQSVLSPDNRKFLENQGKISPEVPRRRIIFGQKSFAFGNDGEFIEVESSSTAKAHEKESATSIDSSSADSDLEDKGNFGDSCRPEITHKLRRFSLQRQKRVDESEPGDFDINSEASEINKTLESRGNDLRNDSNNKESKQIPVRFTHSSNLDQLLEEESSKNCEEIKLKVEEEIKTLSKKIQNASSMELSSILLQMKELRTRLESSSGIGTELQKN